MKMNYKILFLKKGLYFHLDNIAHGSLPNNSNKTRFLYAMRFLTTDNKVNTTYYNYATLVSGKDNFGFL